MNAQGHSRLARLAINNEGFAFDPQTGESFTVNETGREILNQMVSGQPMEVVSMSISDGYAIEHREVMSDVRDFFEQLRVLGLVEATS